MLEYKMLIQIAIIILILSWGVKVLFNTTREIFELSQIDLCLPKFQKTKNHATSLAAKRDSQVPLTRARA